MNNIITDTEMLNRIIDDSGLKRKYLAEQLNLSGYGLSKKINNVTAFNPSEIDALCNLLNIKSAGMRMKIFFKKEVE